MKKKDFDRYMDRKKKDVLKKKLFDILVYIVEPSITDDDVDRIIEKQIMPIVDDFHKERV